MDLFSTFHTLKEASMSYLALLIKMAQSDNEEHESETMYIEHVATQMGLNDEDIKEVRQNLSEYKLIIPSDEHDRLVIFYHLLFLMKIDNKVVEEEMDLCRDLGFQLGLNPLLTDDLINLMAEYANKELPENRMLEEVRKYMN